MKFYQTTLIFVVVVVLSAVGKSREKRKCQGAQKPGMFCAANITVKPNHGFEAMSLDGGGNSSSSSLEQGLQSWPVDGTLCHGMERSRAETTS